MLSNRWAKSSHTRTRSQGFQKPQDQKVLTTCYCHIRAWFWSELKSRMKYSLPSHMHPTTHNIMIVDDETVCHAKVFGVFSLLWSQNGAECHQWSDSPQGIRLAQQDTWDFWFVLNPIDARNRSWVARATNFNQEFNRPSGGLSWLQFKKDVCQCQVIFLFRWLQHFQSTGLRWQLPQSPNVAKGKRQKGILQTVLAYMQ